MQRLLPSLSYREAMELSYFGAKVIHPRTIGPLLPKQIPCVIKNTGNSSAPGSVIDGHVKSEELQVKGITNLDNVAMFNVSGQVCKVWWEWPLVSSLLCQKQGFRLF